MAGTEAEQLTAALDRLRTTFRFKADGLDAVGLNQSVGASTLTLGGLLKHLALVEDHQFSTKLTGAPLGDPWSEIDWDADPSWEFTSAAGDSPQTLYALWDGAVARSRERLATAIADGGLDQLVAANADGRHASLRRLVTDMLEEYGRHTGHADLIREAVDGRTGEDPPPGWRPVSAAAVSAFRPVPGRAVERPAAGHAGLAEVLDQLDGGRGDARLRRRPLQRVDQGLGVRDGDDLRSGRRRRDQAGQRRQQLASAGWSPAR